MVQRVTVGFEAEYLKNGWR